MVVVEEANNNNNNNNSSRHGLLKSLTRDFLRQRYMAVLADESLKEQDPLTLSTVWYRLRPKFIAQGITFSKSTRRIVEYDYIRSICEDELGVKRADLGIHAAVRVQYYFRGEVYDISLDNIEELADMGTDIIAMEKEGAAEVLGSPAAMTGIGILNSRGFFTENADDFTGLVLKKL